MGRLHTGQSFSQRVSQHKADSDGRCCGVKYVRMTSMPVVRQID